MKLNSLPLLGMLAGLGFAITSWVRYYVLYPDLSTLVADCAIGCLIFAVFWVYNHSINTAKAVDIKSEKLQLEINKLKGILDNVELNIKERLE